MFACKSFIRRVVHIYFSQSVAFQRIKVFNLDEALLINFFLLWILLLVLS